MFRFKLFFTIFLLVWVLSACGKGVMNDTGDHQSNSQVTKNSLPSPEVANERTAGSGTLNPYPAEVNSNSNSAQPAAGDFWTKAAQSGLAEVELSQLAQSNAQSADVKQFAQMMIADHTKANNELKSLAAGKNVTLPTSIDTKHQALRDQLSSMKGAEFDKAYVDAMVQDHQEAVSLFQTQSQSAQDADVKAWAAKTLPTLQTHLDRIKAIQAKQK